MTTAVVEKRESTPQVASVGATGINLGKVTTAKASGIRVYLAGPFFSPEQIALVEELEKALNANPTVLEVFSPMRNQLDHLPFGSFEWRQEVFKNDVDHIDWADVVVAVHDYVEDHVDSGTAWEMGYCVSKGKPLFLLQTKAGVPVNLMISESIKAYFTDTVQVAMYDFYEKEPIQFTGEVF